MSKAIERNDDVEKVARSFEACETPAGNFRHQDHLTVAVWYLQTMEVQAATDRMRTSLFRFLDHHKVDRQKYHETLTVFWVEMVARCLASANAEASLSERCSRVHATLGDKDLVLEFYSNEVLWSEPARNSFVKPDKKSWS